MKKLILSFLSFLLIFSNCTTSDKEKTQEAQEKQYAVIAYLSQGNKLIKPENIAVEKLSHINFAFANIVDGKIAEGAETDSANFEILNDLKERQPELKLLISVGGWGWSGNFSDMALTVESREVFIKSCIDFINKHQLDGIDLDWEYPALIGNNNKYRPEDKENFTTLLKELRTALSKNTEQTDKNYLLTIAAAAFPEYVSHVELSKIVKYLDFINLMTYDFVSGWDKETGHHTNLYSSKLKPDETSVDKAIQYYIEHGAPANKLVLGAAFYGRGWTNVKAENNGLFQTATGNGLELSFHDIQENYLNKNGFVYHYDSVAEAPYLWNNSTETFITYENTQSIIAKCAYTEKNKLYGIMFWQYTGDFQEQLLNSIISNLN